ncbi:MAG: ABC-ATPase domain-containing protein [Deltaproteobacteria bacterium]|nr:ABC-ATPase domain-containing protein [Candidatus Zymogenaceae bacterium]
MKQKDDLSRTLKRIDRKGYKAYKDIFGVYDFGGYVLAVDHVQGDPFAAPSRVCVITKRQATRFSQDLFSNRIRVTAAADFLTRCFSDAAKRIVRGGRGMGKSGLVGIDRPGQEVLPRNSCVIDEDSVQVRFVVGLPAAGRTILGNEALSIFFEEIPRVVEASLRVGPVDERAFREHVDAVEDQEVLRERLGEMGLVAFVGNGSILPRRSGVDDRPLTSGAIPFQSPESLRVSVDLPHRGSVIGMGIPRGVTLIVGGGFHGKSTLLVALERGVYPHVPGDGRELVVTDPGAVKIRAEDGRYIERVNISPFITNLPYGRDTSAFSTDNASGSTSQAANIIESLEMGARVLLIDEDTSATNFMIRDERMQELISKEKEPITPFVDKVKKLHSDFGVSTVLVMGGSGDYFDVADTVIAMENYLPEDVTDRAAEVAARHRAARTDEGGEAFGEITQRTPVPDGFDPSRGKRDVKIDAKGLYKILYGREDIDLSGLSQLVDESQTRAIGNIIHRYATRYATRGLKLSEGVREVYRDMEERGLDDLTPYRTGNLAQPRIFEVAGAINRMRTLSVK